MCVDGAAREYGIELGPAGEGAQREADQRGAAALSGARLAEEIASRTGLSLQTRSPARNPGHWKAWAYTIYDPHHGVPRVTLRGKGDLVMRVQVNSAKTALSIAVVSFAAAAPLADAAGTKIPARWRSCKAVNAKYLHGVGKVGAHDKTTGEPVTNFTHSNYLYRVAMRYNRGLDRDKDGIACEKV